jgi:hypothetical protein
MAATCQLLGWMILEELVAHVAVMADPGGLRSAVYFAASVEFVYVKMHIHNTYTT